MQPTRLFDCIAYHLSTKPVPDMLAAKENGQWRTYSTAEIDQLVRQLSAGLLNTGISCGDMTAEGRDKIAVMAKNRPEWLVLDLAVQQIGAILTPVYPTINVKELEFVLNDAKAKMIVVNDADGFHKVMSIKDRLTTVKDIFCFEPAPGVRNWKEILDASTPAAEQKVTQISDSIKPSDLATIIYTSGTTGTPKGVMLSHDNIMSNILACVPRFPPGDHIRALSFLPLNHIFERMVTYLYLFKGTAIYYAESMDTIGDNLKEVQPQIFTTVPRLLEKVYDRIMAKGAELTGIKKSLFFWAHRLAERFDINVPLGGWYKFQLGLANKIIFSKWREALGNNVVAIVSGGAACQARLIKIFTAANIPVMEGYGLTETSPVIAVNSVVVADRKFGTVGPLINNVDVKIAEDGEILCKGPNVMLGYYKRPDLTAESIVDGWYHTGDIGIMDGRFLKITDRKKEMFKTSGGKYVAPLPIENKLKESVYIEQVMVVGEQQKLVGALIVPSFSNLKDWCREQHINYTSDAAIIAHPEVIKLFRDIIDGFNPLFNHVEQVKKFELLPKEWSVEGGELTPKLSMKRKVIAEKYRASIDKIYAG